MLNPKSIDISKGLMSDFPRFAVPQGGLIKCHNLIPWEDVYAPLFQPLSYSSNTISGIAISGKEFIDNTDVYRHFFGTSTKLYRMETNRSFTDVTRSSGGDYATGSNTWSFSKYGEWVLATNYIDDIQILKGMTTANFTALGGSPPKCKYLLMVHGHLLLFYINDGGTIYPTRVIHCPQNDIENWSAAATGYSRQDLSDALGEITGVGYFGDVSDDGTNRSKFAIFHPDSITICYYVGAPLYFTFESNRIKGIGGIPNTMITVNNIVYFWSENDINYFDGVQVVPIGFGVRRTVLDSVAKGYYHRITTSVDLQRNVIYWSYPATNTISGEPTRILAYNYNVKRFAIIDKVTHQMIMTLHKAALFGDDFDDVFPLGPDSYPFDLDSNLWLDDAGVMGIVDSNGYFSTLTGEAVEGTIETGEIFDGRNGIYYVDSIRPKVSYSTSDITARIGTRENEDEDVAYGSEKSINKFGEINVETAGRYVSIEMKTRSHRGISGIDHTGRTISEY